MRLRLKKLFSRVTTWRPSMLVVGLALLGILQAAQFFYPLDRLPPLMTIDGLAVGGEEKSEAANKLDRAYKDQKINIRLGDTKKKTPLITFSQIGTTTTNSERLSNITYPWYLRIIPTSIFWAGQTIKTGEPKINKNQAVLQKYIDQEADKTCRLEPKPASLKANGTKLDLIPAEPGLRCEESDLKSALAGLTPDIATETITIRVEAEQINPSVSNDVAEELARQIENHTNSGVPVYVGDETVLIPQNEVLAWLDFKPDQSGELSVVINPTRASDFLNKNLSPKVAFAPGISYITTRDFVETDRKEGNPGLALDVSATLEQVRMVVIGRTDAASVITAIVPPRIEYTRTYSSTDKGLNALLTNYAKDNQGEFGISLVELSGERRRAEYSGDKKFITASTYKLFVAYSTLKRIESGQYSWNDLVAGGRPLNVCFDDMIARSDNPCAEALMDRVGFRPLTDDAKSLGLKNTTFLEGDRPLTSANDLTTFLATLESGQMLKSDSRQRLIGAMERNIFRQGIPAGSGGKVANKVGFLENLLHDAAIVKDSKGTYVLTVLTKDSSWKAIADLTREIEKLRTS